MSILVIVDIYTFYRNVGIDIERFFFRMNLLSECSRGFYVTVVL